jgi:hypothetical protein
VEWSHDPGRLDRRPRRSVGFDARARYQSVMEDDVTDETKEWVDTPDPKP